MPETNNNGAAPETTGEVPKPPSSGTITIDKGKAWGWTKDILSLAVIPLFLWGVKLEVGNALRDERIHELQEDLKEAQDIEDGVQANALKLATLQGQLDTANGRLREIISLIREDIP